MLLAICQFLYDSAWSTAIRESNDLFNVIESFHVISITLMAGTIFLVDLRILGLVLKGDRLTTIANTLLPVTWTGFAVMALSGSLLFYAEAIKLYYNPMFRLKLVLLVLAGLNVVVFHRGVYRRIAQWDEGTSTPAAARAGAVASLALWGAVIVTGRLIAYFHSGEPA